MEGILLYYKSKGKNPEKHKCVLVIGDSGGPYRDEFLMLNKDEKTIKMKVKLADMEKLAQYPRDGSWEFGTRAGKSFRYRSENDVENKRWFDLLDGFVNKRGGVNGNNPSTIQALVLQPPNNQAPPSQTSSNNNSFAMQPQNNNARNDSIKSQQQQQQPIIADGIRNGWDYYNVKIVDTRSTSTICAKFLVDDIYEFSLEQYAISLKNKFNVQDNHRVGAELIRSFGFYDGYFCIELGRRSGYGEGYLTLNSTRSDANRVHRHLYELTRQTFDQLKQEMDREETPRIRNDANGSFENDDEEDEDDDDDDDMMERNRVNQIKYTNVYLQPQQQHQQYQQQAPPNPSQQQQQQQVKPPPNNNNNNNSYQSQPLQQRPQQPQYLTIIREDNNATASYHTQQQQPEPYGQSSNNNNRQQQPPPTTSKTANLKTTKVQIHRIEPTNQAQQGGYNNANNSNQRPDYPYPDRSTILSTSSSVDSDHYQYRPYQTQSPNDEFMRGQQQQDMNVYKAVLVNNVYEPNNNQNTTTAQNSTKSSQKNQKQPPPQQQQQQQQQYTGPKQTQPQQQYQPPQQQQSYYNNGYNTTNGAPTNGNGNGTAGRIGMNGNNNPSTSYNSYPRTSMITAGMDHSGFSLVEEIEHYESETDESFYEERYVPHYVSNSSRNLSSSAAALEYFQDSGNTVYGKFKL